MSKAFENTIANIPYYVCGIPCYIGITYYYRQDPYKGSAYSCDSDWDYYGYEESDWEILDRKGYKAPWLERKLTTIDKEKISIKISEYMEKSN